KNKLADIKLVYEQLNELFKDELVDDEDYFRLLAEKISESDYIKEAEIYIDGFHMLTNLELTVLQQILKYAKQVTMLFTLDDPKRVDMTN
ncbi:ATP-dependent nuclease subunit B, partial [Stutzerimonas degradans]